MILPFEIPREFGFVVAVFIGLAFGFVLERAGFGRATKLAAQFYFRDMTVFKVMFTAIVTAMLGLVAAAGLGLTDLRAISESIVSWTYVWPMLIGGFVLGAGFIISGYCPGTSIVSAASGNVDGAFAVAGVVTGTLIYTQLLRIPAFLRFHDSGEKEAWFLYDLVPVVPAVIAIAVAVMAVLAFIGAEAIERIAPRTWRLAVPAFATLALIVIAGTFIETAHATPRAASKRDINLAQTIATEPWTLHIVDVRDAASFAKGTVPGAENLDRKELANLPEDGRTLVVIDDAAYAAWKKDPLAAQLSGARPVIAAAPRATGTFVKPKKKGGGCSS
jgi:hypothetical protein